MDCTTGCLHRNTGQSNVLVITQISWSTTYVSGTLPDLIYLSIGLHLHCTCITKKGKMEARHAKVIALLQAKLLRNQIVLTVLFFCRHPV